MRLLERLLVAFGLAALITIVGGLVAYVAWLIYERSWRWTDAPDVTW